MSTKAAIVQEANADEVKFTYNGTEYTVPKPKLWPLEVLEAQEDGKFATCMRALLGETQYSTFKSKGGKTLADLEALTEAAFSAINTSQGESAD